MRRTQLFFKDSNVLVKLLYLVISLLYFLFILSCFVFQLRDVLRLKINQALLICALTFASIKFVMKLINFALRSIKLVLKLLEHFNLCLKLSDCMQEVIE